MENFVEAVGIFAVVAGGLAVMCALVFLFWWLAEQIYIAASNRFRDICRAESLIHEYRRNRSEYLWWKEHVKGDIYKDNGPTDI